MSVLFPDPLILDLDSVSRSLDCFFLDLYFVFLLVSVGFALGGADPRLLPSHYTVPYDQVSFPDRSFIPILELSRCELVDQ